MKNKWVLIPIPLYIYIWLGIIFLFFYKSEPPEDAYMAVYGYVLLMCGLLGLGAGIFLNVAVGKHEMYSDSSSFVILNAVIKVIQVPAYVLIFILSLLSSVAGPWAIGIWAFLFFIDATSIVLSGIFSIAAMRGLMMDCRLNKIETIAYSFASFIFCIDVIVAVVLAIKTSSTKAKDIEQSEWI